MKYLVALILSGCAISSGPNSVATVTLETELAIKTSMGAASSPPALQR